MENYYYIDHACGGLLASHNLQPHLNLLRSSRSEPLEHFEPLFIKISDGARPAVWEWKSSADVKISRAHAQKTSPTAGDCRA